MRVNSESISNEIYDSGLECAKHPEQRIWTWRGIVIDLRREIQNAFDSVRVNSESISNGMGEKTT
jgi:hypothetical protein